MSRFGIFPGAGAQRRPTYINNGTAYQTPQFAPQPFNGAPTGGYGYPAAPSYQPTSTPMQHAGNIGPQMAPQMPYDPSQAGPGQMHSENFLRSVAANNAARAASPQMRAPTPISDQPMASHNSILPTSQQSNAMLGVIREQNPGLDEAGIKNLFGQKLGKYGAPQAIADRTYGGFMEHGQTGGQTASMPPMPGYSPIMTPRTSAPQLAGAGGADRLAPTPQQQAPQSMAMNPAAIRSDIMTGPLLGENYLLNRETQAGNSQAFQQAVGNDVNETAALQRENANLRNQLQRYQTGGGGGAGVVSRSTAYKNYLGQPVKDGMGQVSGYSGMKPEDALRGADEDMGLRERPGAAPTTQSTSRPTSQPSQGATAGIDQQRQRATNLEQQIGRYTEADILHTAQKYGVTPDEVRRKLGL